jgi:hypothetical protein
MAPTELQEGAHPQLRNGWARTRVGQCLAEGLDCFAPLALTRARMA